MIMETMTTDNCNWLNGRYFFKSTEIRCFSTKEAEANNAELWIDDKLIKTGKELGAKNWDTGSNLLFKYLLNLDKPQVDFERVNEFIELLKESHNNWVSSKATDNMILFFKLLASNPSFAHLASKELKELMKGGSK